MAISNDVIHYLEIILILITLCTCSNASELNEEQLSRDKEIARLTASGMVEPELFYDLMHKENFDNNCSLSDRLKKMENITHKDMFSHLRNRALFYEDKMLFEHIYDLVAQTYEFYNMSSVMSFEDVYSIVYYSYTEDGFKQIRQDTNEGRQIRNALYRLAIVQSKDPSKYHNSIFYRGESELNTWYETHYYINRTEKWTRFTGITEIEELAAFDARVRKNAANMTSTVYEMHFPKPFLNANISQLLIQYVNTPVFLVLDTEFITNERTRYWTYPNIDLRIKITHNDKNLSIFEQQKEVMIKLKELKDSGTQFYVNCD
ncbi:uncharacterized protein LOC127284866 [Leptopilina boulardi]|uniref:uncharacterized protein LOC127284866 n=1 Tax=Leptopilina boulardi TaxID=63433 RepID=UPI0021F64A53|nr:uncharacterized protein LOC127284866 [Leptopilina boulardi]